MKQVLLLVTKAMVIIIVWNLALQLISGASTIANIVGVYLIAMVIYCVVKFVVNQLKGKEHEK